MGPAPSTSILSAKADFPAAPSGTAQSVAEQLVWIQTKVRDQMDFYSRKRNDNRNNGMIFTLLPAAMSGISTFFVGLGAALDKSVSSGVAATFTAVALLAGASATFFATWEAFFGNRKLWVLFMEAEAAIWILRDDIDYRLAKTTDVLTAVELHKFKARLDRIVVETESKWAKVRSG